MILPDVPEALVLCIRERFASAALPALEVVAPGTRRQCH